MRQLCQSDHGVAHAMSRSTDVTPCTGEVLQQATIPMATQISRISMEREGSCCRDAGCLAERLDGADRCAQGVCLEGPDQATTWRHGR